MTTHRFSQSDARKTKAKTKTRTKTKHMIHKRNKTNNETSSPRWPEASILTTLSASKSIVGALAYLLLVSQAPAASFSFSTGNPDGKIATLSRSASSGKLQTETADDFVVTQSVVIA